MDGYGGLVRRRPGAFIAHESLQQSPSRLTQGRERANSFGASNNAGID